MFGWRGRRRTGSDAGWAASSGPVMLLDPERRGQEAADGWPEAPPAAAARVGDGWASPAWDDHVESTTWDDRSWEVGRRDPSGVGAAPWHADAGVEVPAGLRAATSPAAGDRLSGRRRWPWRRGADRPVMQAPGLDTASDVTIVRQVGAGPAEDPTTVTPRRTRRLTRLWQPPQTESLPHVAVSGPTTGPRGTRPTGAGGLLARDAAAEMGIYLGGGLIAVAFAVVINRAWPEWGQTARWLGPCLLCVALLTTGLFLRLPLLNPIEGPLAAARRRAISALLTAGATIAVVLLGVVLSVGQLSSPGVRAFHAGVAVSAALVVTLLARSPLAESAVLLAMAWSCWLMVPAGPWAWSVLTALGLCWSLLAWGRLGRFQAIRGERTAAILGGLVALVGCVGLAAGSWAWPTRAVLVLVAGWGLLRFVRGGATGWLFLGAGAAAASGAAVAGELLGPALALCAGGAATMVVSWLALRGTAVAEAAFPDMERVPDMERARPPEGSGP